MKYLIKYSRLLLKLFLLILVTVNLFSCGGFNKRNKKDANAPKVVENNLLRIIETNTLTAVVDYNSTNYFVYRGKPMGFQYELLQALSNDLGVDLEIVVSNNMNETFDGVKNGTFDVIAKNLTVTKQRNLDVDFTVPLEQTRQVLVQRKIADKSNDSIFVTSTLDLAGKEVHVQKNTTYGKRLINLSEEIGYNINIVEDSVFGVEELVTRVANGEIDYTVCDENVAILNKTYYSNLDISLYVSFPQNIAWAVKKGSVEWKDYLDNWITEFKSTRKYSILYHKYFLSSRVADRMDSDFHSISGGNISKYDEMIKKLALEHNWDWRLIASVIYHESRFNAEAGSWAGAYGLMQLMESTAQSFDIEDYTQPKQNVEAGILFLNWLNRQFEESIPDSTERVKFVLASYNVGLGHVYDAQRLAEKYGKCDNVWDDNVEFYLKNKSVEKFYNDSVVRYGYCRGKEATDYVERVTSNYNHYLNVIDL